MKTRKRTSTIVAIILAITLISVALVVYAYANSGNGQTDAMIDIEASLSAYKIGETISVKNDGYIGIPVEVSNYYDTSKGATKPGYNGTPLIVYVVNTRAERIGKKTDVEIIQSLLNRGYIVQIFDYLNNSKAISPDLDWSTQTLRQNSKKGSYFTDNTYIKAGTYYDTILLPAGYDVSLNNVFWETDKHGADGDLEKIVENWNTDLRGWFRNTIVYWRNAAGEQKATQPGFDKNNEKVVWYSDAAGKNAVEATASDANYVKLQHTKAPDVTDCVGKDGTPIDLNLYMHVIYPTDKDNTLEDVPVIALANSSEYLSGGLNTADRPQMSGFLFNGYAGVVFDYLYQPMAQDDYYGYYDGRTELNALTGDRMNYGLQLYDDKRINTAAMRYIRYLTLTNPETYSFDIESIGVYGNSKGGWFTFLGEAELTEPTVASAGESLGSAIDTRINAYTSKRIYENHSGETRYQNGKTESYIKNGVTIDGGELQPWLTYTDKNGVEREIPSYASWIYASCGAQYEDITEGHAPVFAALQMRDDFTATHNLFAEVTKNLDVPSLYVIVDYGHTFAYGSDFYYGYNTYVAMFDFANYYLKDAPVKVIYTDPAGDTGRIDTTPSITIKFSGAVPKNEIEKITLVSGSHTAVGEWTSVRGDTEWTFEPNALLPGAKYVLTIPSDMSGDNGVAMGSSYTTSFVTEGESVSDITVTAGALGNYFTLVVPEETKSDAKIRFHVANDAANVAELYTVSGFDPAFPDSSVKGSLVGSVNLSGAGYYEIDVTEYVYGAEAGSALTFLMTPKKAAGESESVITSSTLITTASFGSYVRKGEAKAPDGTDAAKIYVTTNVRESGTPQYAYEKPFYANATNALTVNKLLGSTLTNADLGRKYHISVRLYDTDTRVIQISLNRVTGEYVHDQYTVSYNFMTEAGKWKEYSFDYTVYEPIYGEAGLNAKSLNLMLGSVGCDESAVYISDITITETVTGIELASDAATLVLGHRGAEYKESGDSKAFTIGTVGYDSFGAALAAAKSGETVVLNKNYIVTDSDDFTGWDSLEKITLDLNGYKLYNSSKNPVIHAAATSIKVPKTTINIIGGEIYLSSAALIGYKGSSASGDGKVFNVNVSGTSIYNSSGSTLTAFITEKSIESVSGAEVNVKLNNVNIDLTKRINTRNAVAVFSNGSDSLTVNYEICGGSIYIDNFAGVTVVDVLKKTEFVKNSSGSYTVMLSGEGAVVPEIGVMTESTIATYKQYSAEDNIATYTIQASALSTKYGLIPKEYESAENYPFVLFDENGNFLGAYNAFIGNSDNGSGGVLGAAKTYVVNTWNGTSYGTNPKEAFIVMRRDYTFDSAKDVKFINFAQLQGTVNVDLGGHVLSAGNVAYPIFPAYSKGYSGAAGELIFPSTVIVNNGTLRNYKSGIVGMSTWDSVGGGTIKDKHFNFIFNNVTIGFAEDAVCAGLTAHGASPTNTPGAAAPFNFTYNNCTFDLKTTKSKYDPVIFSLDTTVGNYIKLTVEVNGGKIIAEDPSKVTVVLSTKSDNYGSSVTFNKGSDGEYLKYYVDEGKTVSIGQYTNKSGEILGFVKTDKEGNSDVYILDNNPLITKYGTIPEDKASVDSYPFIVFRGDKTYYGAYATFSSAVSAAKGYNQNNVWDATNNTYGSSATTAVIIMRRDYTTRQGGFKSNPQGDTFDDWAQNKGVITIDLMGNTLSQGVNAGGIFDLVTTKGWGGKIFPTTFNVLNGEIKVRSSAVVKNRIWATVGNGAMANKTFTFNFDRVDFGFAEGATTSQMLVSYQSQCTDSGYSADVAAPMIFNYNNCTFDMVTNAPSSAVTLFNAAPSDGYFIKSTISVKGGEIKAPGIASEKLYTTESVYGSTVTFVADNNGEYTKLYITNGKTAPTSDVVTDAGTMVYAKISTGTSETLYQLISLVTDAGTIPVDKASVADYPFVVFDQEGNYYGAFGKLLDNSGAINKAIYGVLRDNNKWSPEENKYVPQGTNTEIKTAIIVLRRDYTMTASESFANLAHTQGTIILDLGGHTIYSDSTRGSSIFNADAKGWKDSDDGNKIFPSSFVIRNGEFRTHKASVLYLHCWDSLGGNAIAGKTMSWTFENVTFGIMKGATITSPIITMGDATYTSGIAPFNITFNDCTFDFESVSPSVETTLINASFATKYYIKGTVVVNGGKLLAGNMTNLLLYGLNTAHGSSLTFGKGSDEKYFEVHLASGAAAPSFTYVCNTELGETTLTYSSTVNGKDIYTLQASIATKYGNIPARFASEEKYPFAVFRNGTFVIATELFGKDATESALHSSKSAGSVVLLRRNFTYSESKYYNLSQTGSVTIDLDGFTFTLGSVSEMLYAQKKTDYDTTVNVINGTILTTGAPIVTIDVWAANGNYHGEKCFYINFENVNIGVVAGKSASVLLVKAVKNSNAPVAYDFITFTDCTIDIRGVGSTTLFDLADPSGNVRADAKIVGGSIIADEFDGVTFANLEEAYNSLTFTKNGSGEYTKLYIKNSATAPKYSVTGTDGALYFVRTGTDGEFGVYQLTNYDSSSFTPKISVTLYSDFIFNIYLPVTDSIRSVEFDGESVDVTKLQITKIDGKDFYTLHKSQKVNEAAESFSFRVGIENGGKTVYGNWTVSIVRYAKLVLSDTESTKTEKTLVSDILSYVKSAYVYFESPNADAVKAEINALIGENYDVTSVPTDMDAATVGGGFDSATFVLDETPSFVFYPETDENGVLVYATDDYVFTMNGKVLDKQVITKDDGTVCIRIKTYAYGICENISYTINETEISGAFNIKNYYEFAKTLDDAALESVVERLWKYAESAKNYKTEVAGK